MKWAAALGALQLILAAVPVPAATNLVLHLRNGDRITGVVVSEDTNRVVLATSWIESLPILHSAITNREVIGSTAPIVAKPAPPAPQTNATTVASLPAKKTAPPAAKPPKHWKTDLRVGMDVQTGAKDRDIYYGRFKFTYELPYKSNPRKFFRTLLDYSVDYAETDGVESANRMYGSLKNDFDVSEHTYIYNLAGVGFDEVKKIDLQYEVGPGVGYHLFRQPKFVLDVESGLNYQGQDRSTGEEVRNLFGRLAESVTWKPWNKIIFTEKFEFFPNLEYGDQYRSRLESTLSLGLLQYLSLNLSVFNTYDTNPARGVDKNEFLLRSSLGVTF